MRFAVVLYALLCTSAFAQQASDLHRLLDEYVEYRLRESVPLAFHLGRTVSGRDWPDRSSAGIESRRQTNLLYRKRLEPFLTASLSPQDALDARLLRYVLEQEMAAEPVSTYLQSFQQLIGAHTELFMVIEAMPRNTVRDYEDIIARLVVDTGIHARGWTREQAIEYFRPYAIDDLLFEIDRYIAMPAKALAYKIGELRIQELRRQAERKLGTKFDVRDFHGALLRNGELPLELLEEVMAREL